MLHIKRNYFLPLAKNYNIIIFRDTNSKVWFHSELMTPKSIFFSDHNGRRTNWGHSWNKHGTNGCYVSSKYSKNFSKTYVMFTDPIAVRIFSFKFINDLHMKQVCLNVYGTIEIPWNDAPKKTLTLASRELKTDFDLNTTFFHSK